MQPAFNPSPDTRKVASGSKPGLARDAGPTEQTLAEFDAAVHTVSPDEELLTGAPARNLLAAMAETVTSLGRIDAEAVARKQSWFARFTGADLEAQLEFELAIRSVDRQMQGLAAAALKARRAAALMRDSIGGLDEARAPNETLIEWTHALLSQAPETACTARLQRRLANLEALHASNQLARAQMVLAIQNVEGLLDRYGEIERLLFPVWQQHALAVAQSATAPDELPERVDNLHAAQNRLGEALRRTETAS